MSSETGNSMFLSDFFGGIGHEEAMMGEACSKISAQRINYVGNKKRLLPSIWNFVNKNSVNIGSVTDAFGGSGTVSSLFSYLGKNVAYNDLLVSSSIQAAYLLAPSPVLTTADEWKALTTDGSGEKLFDFARTYYAGKFFTDKEAEFIDRFVGNLRAVRPISGIGGLIYNSTDDSLNEGKIKSIEAWYALISHINSVCFIGGRYYNGQTIAKREHRLAHSRNNGVELHNSFAETVSKLTKISYPSYPTKPSSRVYNLDVVDFLSSENPNGGLLYLDPPYGGESSDYASLYRFIEECVSGIRYEQSRERIEKASKFKNKNGYADLFKEVLSSATGYESWVISFNGTSFASLEEIVSIVEGFNRTVKVESASISYNYRKKRKSVVVGKHSVDKNGETRRERHIIDGTDDELLLLARRK